VIKFEPRFASGRPRILVLGAHADDIEIGCGATLMRLFAVYPTADVRWVVFSGSTNRREEAAESARRYTSELASPELDFRRYRDGRFPFDAAEIKEFFDAELKAVTPDIVFTHWRDDRHQDHRVVSDLTWETFRNHVILEYEVPKYDGDMGQPNLFVPVDRAAVDTKSAWLAECFASQTGKQWFDAEIFQGLARLRGMECASESGYAEAFHARKLTIF